MSGKSDFAEQKVVGHLFGLRSLSVPPTYYMRLYTTLPADDGTGGVEVAGNGYSPLAITNNTTNFVFNGAIIENGVELAFPPASGGNWGLIVGFGLWSASSGGDAWVINALESSVTINDGQVFKFPAGDLTFSES
jgi:hypothetical protein